MESGIKRLDPSCPEQIEQIALLHRLLLPESQVARLGPLFMRSFYYRELAAEGLINADLDYVEGRPAGFIVYTGLASTFMMSGFRRHWLQLCSVLTASVLRDPSLIAHIYGVATAMLRRRQHSSDRSEHEILSFGVLPEYRNAEFIRRTGRRISLELFQRAREYFEREKVKYIRMLVRQDNREALFFYHALGCEFHRLEETGGRIIEVTYRLPNEPHRVVKTECL